MLPNSKNKNRGFTQPLRARVGFTLLELIITITIIAIMFGALAAMKSPFEHRQRLEMSAVTLIGDLRQTQQFSRVRRDEYKYYGLRFYDNLGEDSDREGWKIVRYEPIDVAPGFDPETQSFTEPVSFR